MDFIIKQKLFNVFRESFNITDTNGTPFFAVGSPFTFFKKYVISDMAGKQLISLKKRYFRWFARWDIFRAEDNAPLFVIKRRYIPFVKKYKIINKIQEESSTYAVSGNILAWNFSILKDGVSVAQINKSLMKLTDTYVVHVDDQKEILRAISIALVMDAANHKKRSLFGRGKGLVNNLFNR